MKHPSLGADCRMGVVGCKHTTIEFIDGLRRAGFVPDACITIPPELGTSQHVAGYLDLRAPLAERGIPVHEAHAYSLKHEAEEASVSSLKLDLLFVIGWQRLIPEWLLRRLSIGAFGMHGSSRPLPHGRGRSPMNWSLIQNKTSFFTHLFRYEPGIDDGRVAGVQVFDITLFDTALTLHHKNTLAMIHLAIRLMPDLVRGAAGLTPQSSEGATYYPKREPEDGLIDWEDSTTDVYNLVRAVTRPFDGAFTFLANDASKYVTLWRAIPFDEHLFADRGVPGELLHVFHGREFVVKTGTSTLLILESDGYHPTAADVGKRFGMGGRRRRVWENVPL